MIISVKKKFNKNPKMNCRFFFMCKKIKTYFFFASSTSHLIPIKYLILQTLHQSPLNLKRDDV